MWSSAIGRSPCTGALIALAALLALRPGSAHAEEGGAAILPRGRVAAWECLDAVRAEIERQTELTREGQGLGGSHVSHVRRRLTSMLRRVKDLRKSSLWVEDSETGEVRGLRPTAWSPFVRNLAPLHTEVGECAADYRKQKADAAWGKRDWVRRFPGPEPIDRVPSRDALDEVEHAILTLQRQGRVVPASLWTARSRLIAQVAREEERAREQRRGAYEEAKRAAFDDLEQRAAVINERNRREAETLIALMGSLRALVATTQEVEEDRLREMLDAVDLDDKAAKQALRRLAEMEKGRKKALAFSDSKLSRYRAAVQQGWMVPRSKLLPLVVDGR